MQSLAYVFWSDDYIIWEKSYESIFVDLFGDWKLETQNPIKDLYSILNTMSLWRWTIPDLRILWELWRASNSISGSVICSGQV